MSFEKTYKNLDEKQEKLQSNETLSEKEKDKVLLLISKTEDILDDIKLNEIENEKVKKNFLSYYKVLNNNIDLLLDDNKQNNNIDWLEKSFDTFANSFSVYANKYDWFLNESIWFTLWVKEWIKDVWIYVKEEIEALIEFFSDIENLKKIPDIIEHIFNNFEQIASKMSDEVKLFFEEIITNFQSLNKLKEKDQISEKLYTFKNTNISIIAIWLIAYEFLPLSKLKTIKTVEELDNIMFESIKKWNKKVKIDDWVDKKILSDKLVENFPLIWVSRLEKWNIVYNMSFWGIKDINDRYWQKVTDEVIDLIKDKIRNWRNKWDRIVRDNYKHITFITNKELTTILWNKKWELIKQVLEENRNHLISKVNWDYDLFEKKVINSLYLWIWKSKVKWWTDKDRLNAFYEAEISSRHWQNETVKWIEFSKENIKEISHNILKIESNIIEKYKHKEVTIDWKKYKTIIESLDWENTINPILLRYARKGKKIKNLNWNEIPELNNELNKYIENLNNWFDFISPYTSFDNDMKIARKIDREIKDWNINIQHFVNTYKWTLSKWFFERFVNWKKWSLYFIDIKDMWIMNLMDFRKIAKEVNEKWIENIDLTSSWKAVTESFIEFVDKLKKEHKNVKVAIWWDEIYIYDESKIDIWDDISLTLKQQWLKWRLTMHHGDITNKTIEMLDKNTFIIKKFEKEVESLFKDTPNIKLTNHIDIEDTEKLNIILDDNYIKLLKNWEKQIVWTVNWKKIQAKMNNNLIRLTIL